MPSSFFDAEREYRKIYDAAMNSVKGHHDHRARIELGDIPVKGKMLDSDLLDFRIDLQTLSSLDFMNKYC